MGRALLKGAALLLGAASQVLPGRAAALAMGDVKAKGVVKIG